MHSPTFNATRAVTIQARPEEIWPWLVQMGIKRAGWYSNDWLDDLGIPSAERIVPELQHVAVGDLIPMSPDGKQGQWVKDFEPNQWMLWWDNKGDATWSWGLYPQDESQTRLIIPICCLCYNMKKKEGTHSEAEGLWSGSRVQPRICQLKKSSNG